MKKCPAGTRKMPEEERKEMVKELNITKIQLENEL
jgi:hypothetical protein